MAADIPAQRRRQVDMAGRANLEQFTYTALVLMQSLGLTFEHSQLPPAPSDRGRARLNSSSRSKQLSCKNALLQLIFILLSLYIPQLYQAISQQVANHLTDLD
jgi:hypothetical protein